MNLPVPRGPLPGENPAYMASIPRGRLRELGLQGRPGAGEQLRNVGKTVLYMPPEGYPGPREVSPGQIQQGAATPFEAPIRVESQMGIRWASDGTNRVSIPNSISDSDVEAYARPKLAEQALIRKWVFQ